MTWACSVLGMAGGGGAERQRAGLRMEAQPIAQKLKQDFQFKLPDSENLLKLDKMLKRKIEAME